MTNARNGTLSIFKPMKKPVPFYKVLVLSDLHGVFLDHQAFSCFLQVAKYDQPDEIIINGDLCDFPYLSKHVRKLDVQLDRLRDYTEEKEIIFTRENILKPLREVFPGSLITLLLGNHDARITSPHSYSKEQLERLHILRDTYQTVKYQEMLDLEALEIVYNASDVYTLYNCFDVVHGLSLARNAPEKNMSQYVSSGTTGHCFSEDTDILTPQGWMAGTSIPEGLPVATMNRDTGCLEWQIPTEKFVYPHHGVMHRLHGIALDLLVTDKHGIVYYDEYGNLKETTPSEMTQGSVHKKYKIPLACLNQQPEYRKYNDAQLALIVQIVTDGHITKETRYTAIPFIRFHFKKSRKVKRLTELLDQLGIGYTINKQSSGSIKINISVVDSSQYIDWIGLDKQLPCDFTLLSSRQVDLILHEYSITDGCKNSSAKNSYQVCSSNERTIDLLQQIFAMSGYRSSKLHRTRFGLDTFILTVNTRRTQTITTGNNLKQVNYNGIVWCLSVPNHTLLVRRNGKTVITRNSHRLGTKFFTSRKGVIHWTESGCMRLRDKVEYFATGVQPDWQHGFVSVSFMQDGKLPDSVPTVYSQPYLIQDGKTIYEGIPIRAD